MPFASDPEHDGGGQPRPDDGDDAAWARPRTEAARTRDLLRYFGVESEVPPTDGQPLSVAPLAAAPPAVLPPAAAAATPAAGLPTPSPAPPPKLGFRHHLLVLAFALLGGPLGIGGAIVQELQAGLFGFLAAGIIEECLKPSGLYVVLAKWPYALRNRLYTASFAALSGLMFGLIEAATYVFIYFPDKSSDFVLYRFTVPLILHTAGSFIFGLGIRRELIDWANGVARFPKDSRNFFIAAMTLHAGFNLIAVILEFAGVIHLD